MIAREMSWQEWEMEFRPIRDQHGLRWFETFGEDLEEVKTALELNPLTVWTVVDGEGVYLDIINGAHWVNRLNYLITETPATTGVDYYITNNKRESN